MSKNLPLEIEEAKPPTWLPTAHATADLGMWYCLLACVRDL